MAFNQWDLIEYLKKKRRYVSIREIANETKTSIQSITRKIKKIKPLKKKIKILSYKNGLYKRPVTFFKYVKK